MKKIFIILFAVISCKYIQAQSVGIGTSTPNASAQLDIVSPLNNKGLLIPRMTSAQRLMIPSPIAPGLMVYETTTNSFWFYNGSSWVQQASGGTSPWIVNGSDIYNSNAGNVGIGVSAPTAKLHLNGLMKIESGQIDIDDNIAKVRLLYNTSPKGYFSLTSSTGDIQIGTNVGSNDGGKLQLETQSSARLTIVPGGNVGIGTIAPNYKLDVRGDIYAEGNLRLEDGYIKINNSTNTKYWQVSNSSSLGGRLLFLQQGLERVVFQNDGNVGIGGNLPLTGNGFPQTKLHIESGQDAGLSSASNGYLMLGPASGTNIVVDNNEIMARSGFTGTSSLYLQNNGGELISGARLTINKDAEALRIDGNAPVAGFYLNGISKGTIGLNSGGDMVLGTNAGSAMFLAPNGGSVVLNPSNGEVVVLTPSGGGNISMTTTSGGNITMNPSGQVSIGVSVAAAAAYKPTVSGKILCEELKVKLRSAGWPDYVFDKKYQLPALTEVEKFIQQYKHLPNIPSAVEVEKNGIEVGDMQKRMMEKIEELTLYVIELKKEINLLKEKK